MKFDIAAISNIGKRDLNEDSLFVGSFGDRVIAIVADGVGGLDHGEIASEIAVNGFREALEKASINEDTLIDAFESVDRKIRFAQIDDAMRTTAAVVVIQSNEAFMAYMGDTRIYLLRDNAVVYQSIDHSVAQLHVYAGKLSAEDIRSTPLRNRLTRAMGSADKAVPDTKILQIHPGDRLLVCTDGFWEPVTEAIMLGSILENRSAQEWLNAMDQAIESAGNPKQDNYSAIVVLALDG